MLPFPMENKIIVSQKVTGIQMQNGRSEDMKEH